MRWIPSKAGKSYYEEGVFVLVGCLHYPYIIHISLSHHTRAAPLLASASDDCTVKLWDARVRGQVATLEHDYPVTAVAYGFSDAVYSGGLDNAIYAWDLRTLKKTMKMSGHDDTITSLAINPKNTQLLSYSMDSSLKTWDIQPFTSQKNRHLKTFSGGKHNSEKGLLKCAWSPDGSMVTGGSADRMVHIWDEVTTEEVSMNVIMMVMFWLLLCSRPASIHPSEKPCSSICFQDTRDVSIP